MSKVAARIGHMTTAEMVESAARAAGRAPDEAYRGAIGTSIAKVFDLAAACTGLSEKAAAKAGIAHRAVIVHPSSHAGYYPGAKPLSLKLVFEPTGCLCFAAARRPDPALRGKRIGIIISGGNVDLDRYGRLLSSQD